MTKKIHGAEKKRLQEDARRLKNWKRWGPYLSERQWGTVREDYSPDGSVWSYFTHDQARSRAYRWGEDGLLGITDRQCRLCFSAALWNGKDSILKERLFGLTGAEGNHGEDVKECYYYLESSPTHSYMKALYKYPQQVFPYEELVRANRERSRLEPELEITDTTAFDDNKYFDIFFEYAKAGANDILIRITAHNRASTEAPLWIIPTVWFRNTWSWGRSGEGYTSKPSISSIQEDLFLLIHPQLEPSVFLADPANATEKPIALFTENESNQWKLFGGENPTPYVKDAFHNYVVSGDSSAVNPRMTGTKAGLLYKTTVPAQSSVELRFRLKNSTTPSKERFTRDFDEIFEMRRSECTEFYDSIIPPNASSTERDIMVQAYAGLLWTKQLRRHSAE